MKILKDNKIQFSIHYANSLNKMSYYKKKYNLNDTTCLNATNYGKTCLSLPIYPKLTNKEIDFISSKINGFLN